MGPCVLLAWGLLSLNTGKFLRMYHKRSREMDPIDIEVSSVKPAILLHLLHCVDEHVSNTQNQYGFGLCKGRTLQQSDPVQTIVFNMHQPGVHQSSVPIVNALPFTRQLSSRCAQRPLFHLSYAKAQICATVTHCGRSYQLLSCRACNTHPNTLSPQLFPVTQSFLVTQSR